MREENEYLREQMKNFREYANQIEEKMVIDTDIEVKKLREENSKLKVENFNLKSEREARNSSSKKRRQQRF